MPPLYTISRLVSADSNFQARITFNPSHPVFEGHFPGKPVVPGVVLVEISAAVASLVAGKELVLKEASVIKFLQVIEPLLNPVVELQGTILEETEGRFKADLSFSNGEVVFAKLRGISLASVFPSGKSTA
jgi:3-hydroxyacyl-[acyl-carrier-protein] dehydratase